jgi:dipeptidyl aminopeptidase/acylaminoacyl peptidase
MAGLVNGTSPFDTDCESPPVRVKAILNYAGITDVEALLRLQLKKYPDGYPFAVDWIGQGRDRFDLAKRVSPLQWIDASDPPVFTVHGTADETVPYEQATMLHQALGQVGVMSELMALTGRNHTDVSVAELTEIARRMQAFIVRALGS